MSCCDRFGYIFSHLKYTLKSLFLGNPKEKNVYTLEYIFASAYISFFEVNTLPEQN